MKFFKVRQFKVPSAQFDALHAALDAGWRLENDPDKIHARYADYDLAEQVPRVIMYIDLGVLITRVHELELKLAKRGSR